LFPVLIIFLLQVQHVGRWRNLDFAGTQFIHFTLFCAEEAAIRMIVVNETFTNSSNSYLYNCVYCYNI